MAEHLGSKDESTANPCCSEWKDRLLKLQQKCKKTEDARAALKKAVGLYERQFTLMQDDILKLKKACEEEKLQTNNERKDKEKELTARASLENEISALKSELLSLSQKEGSIPEHVNEELKLLRGRVADSEKEINCLQDQLQKEKTLAATDRKKAVEEKKRADVALQSSKAEKSRIEKELSNLKSQLLNLETEKKQLMKDLQKETARADLEKSRADEALKTAKDEQAEAEMAPLMNDVSSLKSEDMDVITSLQGRVSEMETEISRLIEVFDKEKKRADTETKKAEIEKKKANKMREMLKTEQSTAIEQRKLVDIEKKKGEEFAQQLQRLKCEADEVRSKLAFEGSKFKEANKKLEAERKKSNKEKKKSEEQQKIAELSMKNALEEKQRADRIHQQLIECQQKYVKLQKEMELNTSRNNETNTKLPAKNHVQVKQKTKDTKNGTEKIQDLVSSSFEKDTNVKYAEMKLLKKRLKLEKERVKHAKQVADLENRCKKAAEKELHQLKLEFARFSNRVGLCSCYETCNAGKSCLQQNGNANLKRKCMHPESGKELLKPNFPKSSQYFKPSLDSPVQSLPVSGTCTESTSGTASKLDPLLGGSNRKNVDNSALVSSMSSFSDRQGGCDIFNTKENPNRQLQISRLSNEDYITRNDAVVADNNVESKKRKRALNATESIKHLHTEGQNGNGKVGHVDRPIEQKEDLRTKTVGDENVDIIAYESNLENGGKNVEMFKRMLDDDYMKLLNLDSEFEEERYRFAVERPLSPTLPNIEFESNQLDVLEDSRVSKVSCSNGLLPSVDDSCQYIVVFPEIKDNSSLSKIFHKTRTPMTQCSATSGSDYVIKNIVSALSAEEILSPKEKVCVFFSLLLKSPLSITLTEVNHVLDENFLKSIDIFSGQIKKVMSDIETRTMFEKACNLDELITLIQDFIINGKVLIHTDIINSETPPFSDSKASFHQLMIGAILLSSICVSFDRIDSICEASYTISHITTPSTLTFLHIFAYVCGDKLFTQGDYSLIMTVVSSLVTHSEKETSSSCATCPFSIGAVSMEELASLLLKRLSNYAQLKSTTVDLGDVVSLLELVASKMKWAWVCENIVSQLLKLLEIFVVETPLTAVFVLLGELARVGIDANGFQDADVENIRIRLSSFIAGTTLKKTSLQVEFAAVNALLGSMALSFQEICKNSFVSSSSAIDCIQNWFNLLSDEKKALFDRLLTCGVS